MATETHTDAAADLTDAELADMYFVTAIDQAGDYESTEDAIDTYWENAIDTANETGVDSDAVSSAYGQLVSARAAA